MWKGNVAIRNLQLGQVSLMLLTPRFLYISNLNITCTSEPFRANDDSVLSRDLEITP